MAIGLPELNLENIQKIVIIIAITVAMIVNKGKVETFENDLARNHRDKRKADEALWKAWFGIDNVYTFFAYMVIIFLVIYFGLYFLAIYIG